MNEHPSTGESDFCRGSAWAALDETFFALTQDVFPHAFNEGATALLASHDDAMPERASEPQAPVVIQLPEQAEVAVVWDVHQEAEARRAAMRRHPSSFRRF